MSKNILYITGILLVLSGCDAASYGITESAQEATSSVGEEVENDTTENEVSESDVNVQIKVTCDEGVILDEENPTLPIEIDEDNCSVAVDSENEAISVETIDGKIVISSEGYSPGLNQNTVISNNSSSVMSKNSRAEINIEGGDQNSSDIDISVPGIKMYNNGDISVETDDINLKIEDGNISIETE